MKRSSPHSRECFYFPPQLGIVKTVPGYKIWHSIQKVPKFRVTGTDSQPVNKPPYRLPMAALRLTPLELTTLLPLLDIRYQKQTIKIFVLLFRSVCPPGANRICFLAITLILTATVATQPGAGKQKYQQFIIQLLNHYPGQLNY